jgi:hypothetical protein
MNAGHQSTRRRAMRPHRRQGVATLTVVMILFFVMAMVAAYTNRNLIFEQRIATNSYRANRALEAADAGVEWTVAMLNGGRINANCQPSTTVSDIDFRHRYHTDAPINGNDGYDVAWAEVSDNRFYPACVNREGVLSCVCPSLGGAVAAFGGAADGQGSAFRIEFLRPGNAVRRGAMAFAARGCASVGEGAGACTSQTHTTLPTVDGLSGALTTVGLVRALPIAPIAALTAGTTITGVTLNITNADAATGLAVHAGGSVPTASASVVYAGPAGSSGSTALPDDATLTQLRAEANNGWFRKMFGMDPATYMRQPAVRIVDCANGCTSANLTNVLLGYPRNPIWVAGNLNLDTAGAIGTATDPAMLIVAGQLTISADVDIVGFVHADSIVWAAGAAGASVRGAMVAKDTFAAASLATLTYDRTVLDIISLRYGSFVRAPGSWNLIFR